jgi:hypothetical protein
LFKLNWRQQSSNETLDSDNEELARGLWLKIIDRAVQEALKELKSAIDESKMHKVYTIPVVNPPLSL